MKFIFYDSSTEAVKQLDNLFQKEKNVLVYTGLITELISYEPEHMAIVCPIDSLGNCLVPIYEELFPDIGTKIKSLINLFGRKSRDKRKFLSIGSAVGILLNNEKSMYLIATTTMYLEQSIEHTKNVYYAFIGARNLILKIGTIKTVICPLLCTNQMSLKKTATQLYDGFTSSYVRDGKPSLTTIYCNMDIYNNPQPINRQNKEFLIADEEEEEILTRRRRSSGESDRKNKRPRRY
jgi:hypothetical protein